MLLAHSNYSEKDWGSSAKASKSRDLSAEASQTGFVRQGCVVLHKKSSLLYKLGSV